MIIDWSTGWWLGRYKHLRTSVAAEQIVVLLLNVIAFQFESFVSPRFQRNRVSHFHVGRSQMAIEASVRQRDNRQPTTQFVKMDFFENLNQRLVVLDKQCEGCWLVLTHVSVCGSPRCRCDQHGRGGHVTPASFDPARYFSRLLFPHYRPFPDHHYLA